MYFTQAPHPLLAPFIRCYWSLELENPNVDETPLLVLPDGCVELVIHYEVPYRSWQGQGIQPVGFIAGQIKRSIYLAPAGSSGVFAVRFQPHGLHRFTSIPIQKFTDREVELRHLWSSAHLLTDPIIEASSFQSRCTLAERFFLNLLQQDFCTTDPIITWCVTEVDLAKERIDHLAEKAGLSMRQLERRFLQAIGLSPKRFGRIMRLQRAVNQLEAGFARSLTTLAYDLGYADQAHMTRDFKQLTGLTPSHYLAKQEPLYFESGNGP